MNRLNLVLRDKSSTLLLIVGLGLSFFVAVNVLALLNSIEDARKNKDKYSYKHEYYIEFFANTDELEDDEIELYYKNIETMFEEMKGKKGNLSLYGYLFLVGDGMKNPCENIILSSSEKLSQKFVWGRAPTDEEIQSNEKMVIVGNNMEKYIQEINGEKYIVMDSIKYKVVGIYENRYNMNMDYRMDVCTYYDCLDDSAKETIKIEKAGFDIKFSYGSSEITREEMENNIQEWSGMAERYGYEVESLEERQEEGVNQKLLNIKAKINKFFMYLTFVFTIFNGMVISDIWLKRRYNEFVIRRTFGFSMPDIVKLLTRDITRYALCAMAVSIVMQGIYAITFGESHINHQYILYNTLFLAVIMLITIVLTLAVPLVQISRILPANEIRRQKR